eukprot:XP_024997565.1 uncharacterized protein LOC112530034 [Gallus gallus]
MGSNQDAMETNSAFPHSCYAVVQQLSGSTPELTPSTAVCCAVCGEVLCCAAQRQRRLYGSSSSQPVGPPGSAAQPRRRSEEKRPSPRAAAAEPPPAALPPHVPPSRRAGFRRAAASFSSSSSSFFGGCGVHGGGAVADARGAGNIIHGSDSVESPQKEISLWFKPAELIDYRSCAHVRIYERCRFP